MGIVYVFFVDGFEEIEVFIIIDILRCVGLDVEIVFVILDEIVVGVYDVFVFCDKNFENCDFFDVELLFLFGGMLGVVILDKYEGLCKLIFSFVEKNKFIVVICVVLMVFGKLGFLKGCRVICYFSFE